MTEKNPATKKIVTAVTSKTPAARKPVAKKSPMEKTKPVATKTSKSAIDVDKKAKKSKSASTKIKVIRDSFTMPQSDYAKIAEFKELCLKNGLHVKKSELLRAGLHALGKLSGTQLKSAVSALEKIDTGRPKKN